MSTKNLTLKRRKVDSLTLSLPPKLVREILDGKKDSIKEVEQALKTIEESGQIWVHDVEHLEIIINNPAKGTPLNELRHLMELSKRTENIPRNKEVKVKISKYLGDLLIKQLEKLEISRLNSAFSGFVLDLLESADKKFEEAPGEEFIFEVET